MWSWSRFLVKQTPQAREYDDIFRQLFGTTNLTFHAQSRKTSRVKELSLIGAICLHVSAALVHRCRRSDATASRRSLNEVLQVKPTKSISVFYAATRISDAVRRAVRMFPLGPNPPKGYPIVTAVCPTASATICNTGNTYTVNGSTGLPPAALLQLGPPVRAPQRALGPPPCWSGWVRDAPAYCTPPLMKA